jgi:hypothetical protein
MEDVSGPTSPNTQRPVFSQVSRIQRFFPKTPDITAWRTAVAGSVSSMQSSTAAAHHDWQQCSCVEMVGNGGSSAALCDVFIGNERGFYFGSQAGGYSLAIGMGSTFSRSFGLNRPQPEDAFRDGNGRIELIH